MKTKTIRVQASKALVWERNELQHVFFEISKYINDFEFLDNDISVQHGLYDNDQVCLK